MANIKKKLARFDLMMPTDLKILMDIIRRTAISISKTSGRMLNFIHKMQST